MARYKSYDYSQTKLIPVSFEAQIIAGSFEHTLCYLIEHEVDMSVFELRYHNDETGRPAYDPSIMLKIVLYAYSRGITSSREIERSCRENVMFMALSSDTRPHFTTLATFISQMDEAAVGVFRDILLVCDEQGLIGREMFAVDGLKLPSNASKEWSGTKEEFAKKVKKMEGAVRYLVRRHREEDEKKGKSGGGEGSSGGRREREERQLETLRTQAKKLRQWLATNEDKPGKTVKARKSNVTDNDSAKMWTSHGVIQGYVGVAVVDGARQVVVHGEAFGQAQEHDLLVPVLEGTREQFAAMGTERDVLRQPSVVVDSGFHTEDNVKWLYEHRVDGYLADTQFRQRDPRFATAKAHRPKSRVGKGLFKPSQFRYDASAGTCICPAGRRLYRNGTNCHIGKLVGVKFHGAKSVCGPCELRAQCLRYPERTPARQVVFFRSNTKNGKPSLTERMKHKIDSVQGRYRYGQRLGIAEPVFANIRTTLGLDRFSLRGKRKVNVQWMLYCLIHNIGKIHRYGALAS